MSAAAALPAESQPVQYVTAEGQQVQYVTAEGQQVQYVTADGQPVQYVTAGGNQVQYAQPQAYTAATQYTTGTAPQVTYAAPSGISYGQPGVTYTQGQPGVSYTAAQPGVTYSTPQVYSGANYTVSAEQGQAMYSQPQEQTATYSAPQVVYQSAEAPQVTYAAAPQGASYATPQVTSSMGQPTYYYQPQVEGSTQPATYVSAAPQVTYISADGQTSMGPSPAVSSAATAPAGTEAAAHTYSLPPQTLTAPQVISYGQQFGAPQVTYGVPQPMSYSTAPSGEAAEIAQQGQPTVTTTRAPPQYIQPAQPQQSVYMQPQGSYAPTPYTIPGMEGQQFVFTQQPQQPAAPTMSYAGSQASPFQFQMEQTAQAPAEYGQAPGVPQAMSYVVSGPQGQYGQYAQQFAGVPAVPSMVAPMNYMPPTPAEAQPQVGSTPEEAEKKVPGSKKSSKKGFKPSSKKKTGCC